MRRLISLCAICTVLALVTGCKQSSNEPKEPAKTRTWHVRVEANKGAAVKTAGPRRVLGTDGTTVTAAWTAGEKVSAYNVTRSEALTGFLSAQSAGNITTLSGDLTGTIANGDILRLEYLSPAYSSHDGTLTGTANSIDKVCDYAVATVTVTDASSSSITTTDAEFANQQALVKFTLSDSDGSALPSNPTALTVNDGASDIVTLTNIPAATYTANGIGVLYVALPAMSDKNLTLTAIVGADTYTYTKNGASFANGEYFAISVWMTQQAGGSALSGLFSVSATQQVMFSPGNLQYQASTDTWRFAENQWDMVGMGYGETDISDVRHCYIGGTVQNSDNRKIGSGYSGWIDLFGWGTGNAPTKSSMDDSDYSTFVDWGVSKISNDAPNIWHTLTREEWFYLINTRTNAKSKFSAAKVNGMTGLVILPDVFILPAGCGFTAGMTSASSKEDWSLVNTTNIYTSAQWQLMEANGAVFFPTAGGRGIGIPNVWGAGCYGYYWSSTQSGTKDAYCLYFDSKYLGEIKSASRTNGRSVRLVRVVQD